ncbi:MULTISPECIES: winged helix-turn-helix transcriptional regulator [Empedobacter]|uniref:Helix-turn-helix transcriptional regulator n=1 Tax=Empedobacter falsenii TaxID=343874 RepID=A0AAW7DGI3_9FLAO|nr:MULTISPECIES: helix-turn-helix domain-containing protein [Empedobacter]MDM1550618.1 helix-turn-helix transcriptional regulator [Empedobacter falsenii]
MSTARKELSTNTENLQILSEACDVNDVLASISLKWKMQLLYCINEGDNQFSTLKKIFPTLSDQVLGKRLKELKEESLIFSDMIPNTIPSQIKYTTTSKGKELLSIILDLHQWGLKWQSIGNNVCMIGK